MADTAKALDALSKALKLEQEGRAFYLKAAETTADEKGQAMFRSLADDEKLHAEMVQRQLHAIEGQGAYVLLPNTKVAPIDLDQQLFPPDAEAAKKVLGVEPSEIDALHVALEREIVSYQFYSKAAKETADAAGKQMYTWLASAEVTHFNLLMSNYESLVSMGGWV